MQPRTTKPSVREDQLEDARNRERVGASIGRHIEAYFASRAGCTFSLNHLDAYVRAVASGPVAPGSVSRIMRQLRLQGRVDYELVSRRNSLYRAGGSR